MSSSSFQRRQESHRVYLQQLTQGGDEKSSSSSQLNTTSAAIRLTSAATCLDVTKLLRQKFGLPSLSAVENPNTIGSHTSSISALDRINKRLGRNSASGESAKILKKQDSSVNDTLVVVATCMLPRGFICFEHELRSLDVYEKSSGMVGETHSYNSAKNMNAIEEKPSASSSPEPFNIFRTLSPEENPLVIKDKLYSSLQQVQEEAEELVYGSETDASKEKVSVSISRSPARRGVRKTPLIRLFFMPGKDVINSTIEVDGYCSGIESDDDEFESIQLPSSSSSSAKNPQWKRDLIPYSYKKDFHCIKNSSKDQEKLQRERHRISLLTGLKNSGGIESVSGYLLKQCSKDCNIWRKHHVQLLPNNELWYISRLKILRVDANQLGGKTRNIRRIGKHGIVPLNGTLLIEHIDHSSPLSRIPHVFKLVTKEGKTFVFRASSRNAYTLWTNRISMKIIQGQENGYFELAEDMIRKESTRTPHGEKSKAINTQNKSTSNCD